MILIFLIKDDALYPSMASSNAAAARPFFQSGDCRREMSYGRQKARGALPPEETRPLPRFVALEFQWVMG